MTAKVEGAALEGKVIDLLGRYASLQYDELKDLVFADGSFSYAAERELESALERLREHGDLTAPGKWGPFVLANGVNRKAGASVPSGKAKPTGSPGKDRRPSGPQPRR